jgi:hypothetical protein
VILRDKASQNFVDVEIRPDWTGYAIPLDSFPDVDKAHIRAVEFLRSVEIGSLPSNEISLAFLGGIGGHAAVSAETLGEAAP